jgi:hypothetical protein
MGLMMMIYCGMAVKRIGMLTVSVRKMKLLTLNGDSDTDWYRQIEWDMLCVLNV